MARRCSVCTAWATTSASPASPAPASWHGRCGRCTGRVLLLGPRKGKYTADGRVNAIPGANLPLATLGTFILWMGWFGFNGGSVLEAGRHRQRQLGRHGVPEHQRRRRWWPGDALIVARLLFGKADLTMALNGALAGLVAITAEPSTPSPLMATLIGAVGGALVVFAILTIDKMKIDDPVGAISVHGVVGFWGLMAVPLTNDGTSFVGQLVGAGTIFAWVFGVSFVVWLVIKAIMGIRVSGEGIRRYRHRRSVAWRLSGIHRYAWFRSLEHHVLDKRAPSGATFRRPKRPAASNDRRFFDGSSGGVIAVPSCSASGAAPATWSDGCGRRGNSASPSNTSGRLVRR